MQEIVVKTFKFNELSEEVQQKVLDDNRDINIDYEWWEFSFYEFKDKLKEIGIECDTFYFDIDRGNYIHMANPRIVNDNLLLKMAKTDILLNKMEIDDLQTDLSIDKEGYIEVTLYTESEQETDSIKDELETELTEYVTDVLHGFLTQLREAYEYLYSDESVKETIEANEYDFLEDGERW